MSTVDKSMAKAAASGERDNQKTARGSGAVTVKLNGPAYTGKDLGNKRPPKK